MFDFYKKSLGTLVLNDELVKQDILNSVNAGMTNNMFFYGQNGSGKSTIAEMIQRELGFGDNLAMATFLAKKDSITEDGLISVIAFLGLGSMNTPVLVINEADQMTDKQEIEVQSFMDNYCLGDNPKARLILTTNIKSNVSFRLVSRCQDYCIEGPTTKKIFSYVKQELALHNGMGGMEDKDIIDFLDGLLPENATHHNMRTVEAELKSLIG